ncbi:hypothetical protein ACJDU8_10680 [Clostridium sp. WILCCON 0269]|uniref:Uncharacterized protein n=1 Tax=Candidatus Clostridium eludens TaxID=3381663 RepID=A0ABW8SLD5_9CLOT
MRNNSWLFDIRKELEDERTPVADGTKSIGNAFVLHLLNSGARELPTLLNQIFIPKNKLR